MMMLTVPIPEDLSDLLVEMLQSVSHDITIGKGDYTKYGFVLQPWYNVEERSFTTASFAILDEKSFNKWGETAKQIAADGGVVVATSASLNVINRNPDGSKIRKDIHDYPPPFVLHKPPVYFDELENCIAEEDYDDPE